MMYVSTAGFLAADEPQAASKIPAIDWCFPIAFCIIALVVSILSVNAMISPDVNTMLSKCHFALDGMAMLHIITHVSSAAVLLSTVGRAGRELIQVYYAFLCVAFGAASVGVTASTPQDCADFVFDNNNIKFPITYANWLAVAADVVVIILLGVWRLSEQKKP